MLRNEENPPADLILLGPLALMSLRLLARELPQEPRALLQQVNQEMQATHPELPTPAVPVLEMPDAAYIDLHALIRALHLLYDPLTPLDDLRLIEEEFRRLRSVALKDWLKRLLPLETPPAAAPPTHPRRAAPRVERLPLPAEGQTRRPRRPRRPPPKPPTRRRRRPLPPEHPLHRAKSPEHRRNISAGMTRRWEQRRQLQEQQPPPS